MALDQTFPFSINLTTIADFGEDNAYRLRNSPGEIQRPTVMENTHKDLHVQGELVRVIHGRFDELGDPATLAIFHFRFSGSEIQGRRFREASIEINFGNRKSIGSTRDPEVVAIAPDGDFVMDRTTQDVQSTFSGGLSSTLGPIGVGGFEVGVGWERSTQFKREGCVTLSGSRRTIGRTFGKKNTAVWTLKENKLSRSSIPSFISIAILLKHQNMDDFQAIVTVDAYADPLFSLATGARRLFGQLAVDPIFFSQKREDMGPVISNLDKDNLSSALELLQQLGEISQANDI